MTKSKTLAAATAVFMSLLLPVSASAEDHNDAAAQYLTELHERVIAMFTSGLPSHKRLPKFEALVARNLDVERLARRIAGDGYDKMPHAERVSFKQAITRFVATRLAKSLNSSFIERFEVLDVAAEGDLVMVKSEVEKKFALYDPTHRWLVSPQEDGSFKIADVMEAGISFAAMQEGELKDMLDDHGVEGFIAQLQSH